MVVLLSVPTVRTTFPEAAPFSTMAPATPARDPMPLAKPFRRRMPFALTVTAELGLKALAAPARRIPASTTVAPAKVLVPANTRSPTPDLVSPKEPLIPPLDERVPPVPTVHV